MYHSYRRPNPFHTNQLIVFKGEIEDEIENPFFLINTITHMSSRVKSRTKDEITHPTRSRVCDYMFESIEHKTPEYGSGAVCSDCDDRRQSGRTTFGPILADTNHVSPILVQLKFLKVGLPSLLIDVWSAP
ncbi:hypothetical protein L2E82_51139 [Cichorium intybus]|nr:hypothetical protein L2E82_51139 [Cichorium intybus]